MDKLVKLQTPRIAKNQFIQLLRGISFLAVFFFHFNHTFFPLGYLGVDVFFVISGYVITPILLRTFNQSQKLNISSLARFYKARIYRLTPSLLIVVGTFTALLIIFAPLADLLTIVNQALTGILVLGNYGAWKYSQSGYFANHNNPLIHLWSLSAEEQIYIFLPLLTLITIFMFQFLKREQIRIHFLFTVFIVLGLFTLPINIFLKSSSYINNLGINNGKEALFYSPLSRYWEFSVGGLVYLLCRKTKFVTPPRLIYLAMLILVSGLVGYRKNSTTLEVLIPLYSALLIFLSQNHAVSKNYINKFLRIIGDRSYSLYLVHLPILYLLTSSPYFLIENNIVRFVTAFGVTFLLSNLLFHKVENRRYLWASSNSQLLNVLVATMILSIGLFSLRLPIINNFGIIRQVEFATKLGSCDSASFCSQKSSFKKYILLLGDSHASDLSNVMRSASRTKGYSFVDASLTGCEMQLDNFTSNLSDCDLRNQRIKVWLGENPSATVVISERFRTDVNPEFDNFEKQLKEILLIRNSGHRVLIVGPRPEFSIPLQHATLLGLIRGERKFGNPYLSKWPMLDNVFLKDWSTKQGIEYVDVMEKFLNFNRVDIVTNGSFVYFDSNHLTPAGANLMLPILLKKL